MPRQILYIADDLGLSEEANAAMLHAHREGVLDGAGLMMGQPGTAAAVELAREHPELQVGWHLHLNDSRPLTREAWPWGRSPARAGFAIGLLPRWRAFARREIEAQWRAFQATGLECAFANGHHHIHLHPFVRRTMLELLGEDFRGWIRWGRPRFFQPSAQSWGFALLDAWIQAPLRRRWAAGRFPYPLSDTLWGIDRTFSMRAEEVRRVLPTLGEGLHEFMFHPRRIEGDPDTRCLLDLRTSPRARRLSRSQ